MREFYCGEEQIYIDTLVLKVSRPAKHITFQKKKKKEKRKKSSLVHFHFSSHSKQYEDIILCI